ncbi:MAG: DUF1634 domain-containing protein [Candidatus Bathyarchaeota archaeon]|nr:DUF1634 domain-containing protein [Candidatus Bathyarchaeota archaeon]
MAVADPEAKLEAIISVLLIAGLVLSVSLISAGLLLYYTAYGTLAISLSPSVHITGENFFAFIIQTIQNLTATDNALLFMTLGIIILILTPYIRAITSFCYFTWEKNWKYMLITLFVLVVLTVSLALH